MSIDSVTQLDRTRAVFRSSLDSLISSFRQNKRLLGQFPSHIRQDLLNLEVSSLEPPRGGIYDISIYERTIFPSKELLTNFSKYWQSQSIDVTNQEWMCKLYFLHELHHVQQKIDSNTYPYSRNSKTIFQSLDYTADAFAVKLCFLIEEHSGKTSLPSWNRLLANILHAHIRGGEVFSVLDDGRPSQSIDGARLHRQLIWHLQYSRAYMFKPEARFEDFEIDETIALEIFKIEAKERRINLCVEETVTEEDLKTPIEVHILWRNQRIRYTLTIAHSLNNLASGLFKNNIMGSVEAFRPLFDERPELTGRLSESPSSFPDKSTAPGQYIDDWWKRLERVAVDLYYQGLGHNEIWSRAGGDLSGLNLNVPGRGAWHSALKSLRQGGGGRQINRLTLLRQMLEDYPENPELKDLKQLSGRSE